MGCNSVEYAKAANCVQQLLVNRGISLNKVSLYLVKY